ncbi:cuticle protein 7-like, partial [Daphnia pulicaria]|uniref:cuticle protein 7-like n=1 Tax=Daphnia pulicaria TaxID=35523 RepID=UPI001EECBAFD
MKSTIRCIWVLFAVACTRARNVNYPSSLPDISSPSLPSRQWITQDKIGQASFGYSYPGQAASNVLDSAGNMAGSWAYVNPEGKVVNVSYVADERGFRVSSNVLPAAVAPVLADLAVGA